MRQVFLVVLACSLVYSVHAQNPWNKTGGPVGGLGYNIRIHPNNPDIMFVTDVFSGVNKSTDGGLTWVSSNQGIDITTGPTGDAIPVFALTIDPFNPDQIWVGTQSNKGVFFSSDGGATYEERTNGIVEDEGLTIRNFKITRRGNIKTIYLSCEYDQGVQGDEFSKVKGLLYKSEDQGLNWTKIWEGESLARWLEVIPDDVSDEAVVPRLVLATGIFDREAFNTTGEGMLVSGDGGETWVSSNENITSLFIGGMHSPVDNPNQIIIGSGNNVNTNNQIFGGIYKSLDAGSTWTQKLAAGNDIGEDKFTAIQYSKSNPSVVYAANQVSIYRSDDRGETWIRQTQGSNSWGPPGVIAGVPIEITVDAEDEDILFINNYGGGVFKSIDAGVTWTTLSNGYTGAQMHAVSVSRQDHSKVVSIARSGPFLSNNRGDIWEGIAFGEADFPEWYDIAVNPTNDSEIILSDEHQGYLLKSTDDGQTWERVYRHPDVPLPPNQTPEERHGAKAIAYAPSNSEVIYAGYASDGINFGPVFEESNSTIPSGGNGYDGFIGNFENSYGMVRSRAGGASGTWEPINNGLAGKLNVTAIEVSATNENHLYITLRSGGVFKSLDGGDNWTDVTNNLPERNVYSIGASPDDFETVYVGTRFYGVYKSTNGGTSWTQVLEPLKTVQVHSINSLIGALAVNPDNPNVIAAADWWSGVVISNDAGATWSLANGSLSQRDIKDLEFSNDGKFLYAASSGEGVFRMQYTSEALIDLSENELSFQETEIGSSQTINISVENYGNAIANINSFDFDDSNFSTTSQLNQFAVGSKNTIPVVFSPNDEGTINGSLTIKTDAGDFQVSLSGSSVYAECSSSINVSGESVVCSKTSTTISAADGFDTYQWYKDGELIANQSSKTLEVTETATYKVRGINNGNCAKFSDDFEVSFGENPGTTITVDGFRLIAPAGATYQWFLDDVEIAGATNQIIEANRSGTYTVLVTNAAGCSQLSEPVVATSIDSEDPNSSQLAMVYPNPSTGDFTFQFPNPNRISHDLALTDITGQTYWSKSGIRSNSVDVSVVLPKGVFIMKVSDERGNYFSVKVLIEN